MKVFELIKQARISKKIKAKDLAFDMGIDASLVSKFENNERIPTKEQIHQLSNLLDIDFGVLYVAWLKSQIMQNISYDHFAIEALQQVQEEILFYGSFKREKLSADLESILTQIDALKEILNHHRNLDSFKIHKALELEYTFESNKIEGNTLTLRETDLVINEGMTISGKSMREHLEAINHQDAIGYVKDLVSPNYVLKERDILQIHQLVLRGILPHEAGKYRKVQVMISGSNHVPPAPYLVSKEMVELMLWYHANYCTIHPVILAAEMHQRLVSIHPFVDGNGRTSRLVMNLILMQHGYVIANLKGEHASRLKYYKALEKCQTENSKEDFLMLIAQTEKECLERYLQILNVAF
jgi:Fic family protein/DNA-binding Xre family transcriptional regulator